MSKEQVSAQAQRTGTQADTDTRQPSSHAAGKDEKQERLDSVHAVAGSRSIN
jgi:hypothetical protein